MLINTKIIYIIILYFFVVAFLKKNLCKNRARWKMRDDLRIIAVSFVLVRKNIIGIKTKNIYTFYYPEKKESHRETFYLLSTHKFKRVLSLSRFILLNNLK